jgi:flagellar hook-associated protein 2
MATFGIDGLVSGLDTTALINQLMQVEAAPKTLLTQKSTATKSFVTALQGLNTRLVSLADSAKTAATAASWSVWTATSSTTGVTATAGATAQPSTLSFTVDAVAAAQVSVSAAVPDDSSLVTAIPPAVTVKASDGTLVTVSPTTGSLSDIAKALNDAATAGVKATVVRVTNGEIPTYRLQFTGTSTGTDGTFEVYAGTSAEVTAGTATRIDTQTVTAAANAEITLWKGVVGLEQTFNQSSNTFTGLMTGVDVTVSAVTGVSDPPATVTIARDDAALAKLASGLIGSLGVVLSEITSRTLTTTTTNTDGTTSVTGGIFSGDSAVRNMREKLLSAASYPVDGSSPWDVGIKTAKDGTFTFDEAKFATALAADPAKVQSVVSQIAARVQEVATSVSDPIDGTLTLKIQGQQRLVTDYGKQIDDWDRRLAVRRASLERTYSALEVTLSNLKAQSTWLTSQLAALSTSSS